MENIDLLIERYRDDFERWALECVKIVDKVSGREVPFRLNAPQRRVMRLMEQRRREGQPVRVIMLKARQWGGSTLIQVYMAWLQLVVYRGWNSLTCAHVKDASAAIRGMYSRLLRCYPEKLKGDNPRDWQLTPYEKSTSTAWIAARDCQVAIATSMAPNSVRGSNFAMAHLSEVAFWADGDSRMAEEIVRTVSGTVLRCEGSLVVMESTANGTDNYFYREWQRAVNGESDKVAVFVPWHEIELYSRPVSREETGRLLGAMDEYERQLLADGVRLEAVAWYHDKRCEYQTHEAMMAEFPSTPDEAFRSSREPVFDPATIPAPDAITASPSLAVFVPGKRDVLSLFALRRDGFDAVTDIEFLQGDGKGLREALPHVGTLPLMIVEGGDAPLTHGAWCARVATDAGASTVFDDDDRGRWQPDDVLLSEWVDTLAEMLRGGKIHESADRADAYKQFRHSAPSRSPLILARLAAASRCRHSIGARDFNSLWR